MHYFVYTFSDILQFGFGCIHSSYHRATNNVIRVFEFFPLELLLFSLVLHHSDHANIILSMF